MTDWSLIRSFHAVAETGSLSAAARRLGMSQPSLGRHIQALETELGITLFQRGRRGYALSEEGARLFARSSEMNAAADGFARLATGRAERLAGTVRISASEIVAAYVLPEIIEPLRRSEPAIEMELVASNAVENLLRRDADIAIRMVEPSQLDLVARKIADLPLCACAATTYLDRRGRPGSPQDLIDHDLVGYDRGLDLITGFHGFGVEIDRHAFSVRTDNQIVFWELVKAGIGIGFAQRGLARRTAGIEIVLAEMKLPVLPMWLAMHRDVRTSPRIRRVADHLHDRLKAYAMTF
jgi:DNA-binding transcriptional LysR family regulator